MAQAFWHIMGWALIVLSACGTTDSHLISKRGQQKIPEQLGDQTCFALLNAIDIGAGYDIYPLGWVVR